jgi:O-antigen/teichoic acid export membrane protein
LEKFVIGLPSIDYLGIRKRLQYPGADDNRETFARFGGYLSGDALNYLLGFAIYGYLVRILSNSQYGQLSIATTIYQVLMMFTALGLDLIGPRILADHAIPMFTLVRRLQRVRLMVAIGICGPITVALSFGFFRKGSVVVASILLAGFAMVLARAFDVTYLAVTLCQPYLLARTRMLGLGIYFCSLVLCAAMLPRHIWLIPALNAVGITIGRFRLLSKLKIACLAAPSRGKEVLLSTRNVLWKGLRASSGQLILLGFQTMDVLLLSRTASADAVGQYAMVSRLYLLGTAVLTALLNTFLPELTMAVSDKLKLRKHFARFFLWSSVLGVGGSIVFAVFAAPICELLGHRSLPVVLTVVPVFAVSFLVLAIGNPFTSMLPALHCETRYVASISAAAAVVLGLNLLLTPTHGPIGAAIAQLCGTAALGVFSWVSYSVHLTQLSSVEIVNSTGVEA